jgi:hypothetical protein
LASREKKPLNVAQRVEILLREGIDNPKKWATVHGYEEPDMSKMDFGMWHDEWKKLRVHHLAETNFLFDVIRELCEQVKALDDQIDAQLENDRGIDG